MKLHLPGLLAFALHACAPTTAFIGEGPSPDSDGTSGGGGEPPNGAAGEAASGGVSGSGATGGSSGDSGLGASGGSAGGNPPNGAAGEAASGGVSGSSATAAAGEGAGGSGGRPTSDEYARAATVLAACWREESANLALGAIRTPSLRNDPAPTWPEVQCLATHGDGCMALEACLGWSVRPAEPDCVSGCNSERSAFTTCEDGVERRVTGLPGTCDPLSGFRGMTQFAAEACDEATFVPYCNEFDVPVHCERGITVYGPSCESASLGCYDGACSPSNGPTTCSAEPLPEYRVRVQGDACADSAGLLACIADHETRSPCSDQGNSFTCRILGDIHFCGLASECAPGDTRRAGEPATAEVCEGTTLVLCNAGRVERIDCTELGFTGCNVDEAFGCTPGP